jgi:hypothetical protein
MTKALQLPRLDPGAVVRQMEWELWSWTHELSMMNRRGLDSLAEGVNEDIARVIDRTPEYDL